MFGNCVSDIRKTSSKLPAYMLLADSNLYLPKMDLINVDLASYEHCTQGGFGFIIIAFWRMRLQTMQWGDFGGLRFTHCPILIQIIPSAPLRPQINWVKTNELSPITYSARLLFQGWRWSVPRQAVSLPSSGGGVQGDYTNLQGVPSARTPWLGWLWSWQLLHLP